MGVRKTVVGDMMNPADLRRTLEGVDSSFQFHLISAKNNGITKEAILMINNDKIRKNT